MLAIRTSIEMYTGAFAAPHRDDARVGEKREFPVVEKQPTNGRDNITARWDFDIGVTARCRKWRPMLDIRATYRRFAPTDGVSAAISHQDPPILLANAAGICFRDPNI